MALLAAALLPLALAAASISPGDLSQAHAALEGSEHCLDCHARGKGVDRERCLACHGALAERVASKRGLHARPDHAPCERCHVEHQGRDFELVFWGKAGRAAFDHRDAGFELEGAHARLACEACHPARVKAAPEALRRAGANPARTYLGLGSACESCHADPHRGQFAPRACRDCHDPDAWKPVRRFDHARSSFPLTGRHAGVACEGCHPPAPDGTGLRFAGIEHGSCASCHKDAHQGRLGTSCEGCHTTAGWRPARSEELDHSRTRFPLLGRHGAVACEACHRSGQPLELPHRRCTDCHEDRHRGELDRRPDGGRCDACHDERGFAPARFGPDEHGATRFALVGAHLAVPCAGCHPPLPDGRPGAVRFRVRAERCQDCHRNPHTGKLGEIAAEAGCDSCHGAESWRGAEFDHASTRFPLEGRHAGLGCEKCHPRGERGLELAGRPTACAGCHTDRHDGQFARGGADTDCARCHAVTGWTPVPLDHDRDTAFRLDGAHRKVACAGCHPRERRDGREVVRYRPLGQGCPDCHAPAR